MRIEVGILVSLIALTACSKEAGSVAKAEEDARDIAMVEEAQAKRAPVKDLIPEPIRRADLDQKDMFGGYCAMEHPSGLHSLAITRRAEAWIKLDGQLVRFGADMGSPEQPFETRVNYDGQEYSMRLRIFDTGAGEGNGPYEGELILRDSFDREAFAMNGTISCKER